MSASATNPAFPTDYLIAHWQGHLLTKARAIIGSYQPSDAQALSEHLQVAAFSGNAAKELRKPVGLELSEQEIARVFASVAEAAMSETSAAQRQAEPEPPRWPALDPSARHGLAGEFVNTIEPETEADAAALLVQFLAAFGNAAGKTVCRAPDGTPHYFNLFALLCGSSSKARKGSSWHFVKRLFDHADPEWTRQRVQSGLSSGEGVIWAVRDAITRREPVRAKGRIVDYQDVEVDPGVADKRVLLFESEFASVLKVLSREGNTLSATIRQAWDTGDIRTLTKNTPAKATGAHISIIAHITIEELLRYFDSTEAASGFGNRFLFLCVRRSKYLSRGGRVGEAALQALAERVVLALAFARSVGEFEFSEAAYEKWDRLYPALSAERPGLLGSMLARSEAQVSRLAFIYAALDRSLTVEPVHLIAAAALWEYCEASVEYIFGAKLGDPAADAILAALRERPNGLTRTDISNLFARNLSAERIERTLDALLRANLVERRPKGSHTPEHWSTKTTKTTKTT
jgi:hypothetical protein